MKVTTDACLFGAWTGEIAGNLKPGIRNLLDIGSGTGLLSLMLAQQLPEALIDTIEIDKEAAEQAKENVAVSPWAGRIQVIREDVRTYPFSKQYDAIISNPPFYEKELTSPDKQRNLALHSEELSLNELLFTVQRTLAANGSFYILLPYKRMNDITTLLPQYGLQPQKIVLVKQSAEHHYFRVMMEAVKQNTTAGETETKEMAIKNRQQEYTPEFITLLKNYYLYL